MAREPLARLFTDDLAVVAGLGSFLLALGLAQPFLQLHFTLGGAHRGAGDTWTPLIASGLGNWGLRVPMAVVCGVVFGASIQWVWAAIFFDHVVRASILLTTFRRGHWTRTRSSMDI